MGQFLQVNGDYNIKSVEGGKITFDTGPAASGGQVLITGNLVVEGTQTTVEATNLDVNDNIITLNSGETGSGVTLIYSGIEIDRGSLTSASLLYDESADTWLIANGSAPSLNYDDSNLRLRRIYTNPSTDDGDLTLIGTGTGVVKVFGTINYEDQVTADDDIPNKKYVDDSIQNNPTFQIVAPQSQDTKIVIADKEITPNIAGTPGSLAYLTATTGYSSFGESAVSVIVDGELISQFYPNRVEIGDLEISGTEITTQNSITNENIFIRTQGTGKLQTNYALQLEKIAGVPAYVPNNLVLYSAMPGVGTTGVWFVNDSAEISKQNGELISKNKALVFSMIF
jgi:hypothetical protein